MWKRFVSIICLAAVGVTVLPCTSLNSKAASVTLTLPQAKSLALMNSKAYKKIKSKLALEQVKYTQAVKSVALKRINMLTFRWSPLLNFKFPEQPALADEYEWVFKPLQIQNKITSLLHQLEDSRYETQEIISNLYVDAYTCQEKITFTQSRLRNLQETILRTTWQVKTGKAAQTDLDKMNASSKKLTTDVSLLMRTMERSKSKVSDAIGLDITVGFHFSNSYVESSIDRTMLEPLGQYTLDNDHNYYDKKLNAQAGLIGLELNERLMKNKYAKYMSQIQPYINQARQGQSVDEDAFKAAYDQFLVNIDSRWQGNHRILFLKIPKEWFKGERDGVRYIEDDPYVLYTNAMEYQDLLKEKADAQKELLTTVDDSFEALITVRNSYESLRTAVEDAEKDLKRSTLLHQSGKVDYEELKSQQDLYEETQVDMLDTLAGYSGQLYSFDRLTCGGITTYLERGNLSVNGAKGGESYLSQEDGASYHIQSKIEDNMFSLGVCIPEEFKIAVTDFELWVDNTQIGKRTKVKEQLTHLSLTTDNTQNVVIRFYNNGKYVDECKIDPLVTQGPLTIGGESGVEINEKDKKVADFTYTVNQVTQMATISIHPAMGEPVAFYKVSEANGTVLFHDEFIPVTEFFSYLSLAVTDLEHIRIKCYDAQKELLYTGTVNKDTMEVMTADEQPE